MALNVISNYAANVAHRYLSKADAAASSSLAKLSAGTRVISAKDDAASMAIGSRLNAEVQAQKQAQTNAIQASSMLQIADGAMAKVNDILVRMKTLSVQAGSGQLSDTERGMLDTEYQALLSEVDRIADVTKFNGVKLVDGTTTVTSTTNTQGTNNVEVADGFASFSMGESVGNGAISVSYSSTGNALTLTNLATGTSETVDIGATAIATGETQTVTFADLDITVTLNDQFDKAATDIAADSGSYTAGGNSGVISSSGVNVSAVTGTGAAAALQALTGGIVIDVGTGADASNSNLSVGNFSASGVDLAATGTKSVTLSDGSGSSFTLDFNVTTAFATLATDSTLNVGDLQAAVYGDSATSGTKDFTFKLGTGTTAGVDDLTMTVNAISTEGLGLSGAGIAASNIKNVAAANTASTAISSAIDTLNTARATVGAAQNRLDFASDNLATTIENSEAARSSLMDLDVASEMTTFTSKQILLQSGVSMLAQANQMPQSLLKLFG